MAVRATSGGSESVWRVPENLPSPEEVEQLTPKALLQRLGLSARKAFSQSFLTDKYVVRDIIEAAELRPTDEVLEVGPGLGVLTRELVKVAGRVVAVELDRALAELLPRLVSDPDKLVVVQGDILAFDPATVFRGPYKVVANLPYHITSPALRHLLTTRAKPTLMVVMVQKEVAERIAAKPGDTSFLSVMVQLYAKVTVVRHVSAASFFPAPKVDSTVIKLEVYERLPEGVDDPEALLAMVSGAFSRRRKQLHNSLSQAMWFPPGGVFEVLEAAGIDPTRRPQTLSVEEWIRLYRVYQDARSRWQSEQTR
ncbi:MAG: 16S rRNA (adenine(1518)-N(6)/adenine(1519)-N(6))-dimethyltransferase RsmA [Sphingomonadaceae bacterium]